MGVKKESILRYDFLYICLLIVLLGVGSCFDSRDLAEERAHRANNSRSDQKILVGAVAPWQDLRKKSMYRKGLELALQKVNQHKVLGREIELIWKDDHGSLKKSREIAQELAENPDIVAVIGHYYSGPTLSVSLMYEHYGLLMITGIASSTEITNRQGLDLVFQNIPTNRKMAMQLAKFCHNKNYRRMIIYNVNTSYGRDLATAFENRSHHLGIEILDQRSFPPGASTVQFKEHIKRWKEYYNFDALFLPALTPEGPKFIEQCKKMDLDVPIISADGLDTPELWEIGGNYTEGTIVGSIFHPGEPRKKAQDFVQDFRDQFGKQPDTWAAQGYDTLNVLAHAMRLAGTTIPSKVAENLRKMEKYNGVTGKFNFGKRGQQLANNIVLQKVQDQQFTYLSTHNSSAIDNNSQQSK